MMLKSYQRRAVVSIIFFSGGGGGGGGGSKTKQMNQPLKTEKIKNIFFMDNGHIWEGCSRLYRKKNVSHNKLPLIVVDTQHVAM